MTLTRSSTPTRLPFALAAVVLVLSALLAAPADAAPVRRPLNPSQEGVKNALNRDRLLHGRRLLTTQADAQAKAQAWAQRLATEGRLRHSRLQDGIGSRYCSLGENVGFGSSARAVQSSYMASSGHRANILSARWNGFGVGYAKRGNVVYTVQVFIKTC